jgi:CheY-like chemotaxis protein
MLHLAAKILLVDDDEQVRKSIQRLLRAIGFSTIATVSNGKEATDWLMNAECDCIISDWEMPLVNGLELLQKVRENDRTRHIPFILMSGRIDAQLISRALALGANHCLDKSTAGMEGFSAVLEKISTDKEN